MPLSLLHQKLAVHPTDSDAVAISDRLHVSWQDRNVFLESDGFHDGRQLDLTREQAVDLADLMLERWSALKAKNLP